MTQVFAEQHETQVQRIYHIAQFKHRLDSEVPQAAKQASRPEDICKAWNQRVKVSSGEAVSSTFVEAALYLHKHVLSDTVMREHILGVRQ